MSNQSKRRLYLGVSFITFVVTAGLYVKQFFIYF